MEETTLKSNALSVAQQNMIDYFTNHDVKYVAEDAVFRNLNTGETYKGKAEIGAMLHYMYHVAFDAKAEVKSFVITEEKAVFEASFRGRHIGEIAGIPATGHEVNVPLCVTYELKDGLIREARIYMLEGVMMQQLGVNSVPPKTSYLVRDIFHLKFGHFRDVKALMQQATEKRLMPADNRTRAFTDFTGDAYRLILEEGFDSLADYEETLTSGLKKEEWQQWYEQFKPHVERSYREILKQLV